MSSAKEKVGNIGIPSLAETTAGCQTCHWEPCVEVDRLWPVGERYKLGSPCQCSFARPLSLLDEPSKPLSPSTPSAHFTSV